MSVRFPVPSRAAGPVQGHAFIVALLILGVITSLSALAITRTSGSARLNSRAADYAEGERVADGMIEYAYGVWKQSTHDLDRALTAADLADLHLTAPTVPNFATATTAEDANGPLQIRPANEYGAPWPERKNVYQYLEDYPGWRGYVYNYVASVKIKATEGLSKGKYITGAKRNFEYIQVPLFQSMFFFEDNLELYRTAPMTIGGLVHTNSRLLASGVKTGNTVEVTFQGNVSYANKAPVKDANGVEKPGYSWNEPPIGGPEWAGLSYSDAVKDMEEATYSRGGVDSQLARVGAYKPLGASTAAAINTTDTSKNNDSYREIIEPPVLTGGDSDPDEIKKRRLYSKAGIIMEITAATNGTPVVNVTTQGSASLNATQLTALKTAFTGRTTLYDQRELKDVSVANIDVSVLTSVLNTTSGFNGVLYVHDTTPITSTDKGPRTVRLNKGGILPDQGLTIASQNPVYVKGDYNTGTTTNPTDVKANSTGNPNNTDSPTTPTYTRKPAAVIADAVMLLSNNWNDANDDKALSSRVASNTTYNMAILAGYIPSGYDKNGDGTAEYGYAGGANNYPRFLETWSNKTCNYNGSMVELFVSQIFTGKWDTGNIYGAPVRRWNYDNLFNTTPPPGSVDAITTSRGPWSRL